MMSLTSSSRFRNLQSYIIHCTSLVSFFGVYWSIYHQNNTSSSSTSFPGFSPIRPYEERTWERGRLEFHHSLVSELYFLSRGQNLTKLYFAVVYYFRVKATILDRNVKKNGRCRVMFQDKALESNGNDKEILLLHQPPPPPPPPPPKKTMLKSGWIISDLNRTILTRVGWREGSLGNKVQNS